MDIQAEINWIHQEIDKVKDPSFVQKLKHLLQSLNTTADVSTTDYNTDIDNALESIKNGNFHSDVKARSISKKWGRK